MKNKKKLTKKETEILKEEIKQFLLENPDIMHLIEQGVSASGGHPHQKVRGNSGRSWIRPKAWYQNMKQAYKGIMDPSVDDRVLRPGGKMVVAPSIEKLSGDDWEKGPHGRRKYDKPARTASQKAEDFQTKAEYDAETQNELDNFNLAMAAIGVMSFGIGMGGAVSGRVGAGVYKSAVEKGIAKEVAKQMQEVAKNAAIEGAKEAAKQGLKRKATEKMVAQYVKVRVRNDAVKRGVEETVMKAILDTAKKQIPKHMGSLLARGGAKMIEWNPLSIALKHGLTKMGMSAAGAEFAGIAATLLVEGWGVVEQFFCNAPKIETKDGKGFRIYDDFFKHIDPFNWLLLAFERVVPGGNIGGWEGFLEKDKQFGGVLADTDDEFKKHEGSGGMILFLPKEDQDEYWALRGEVYERAAALQNMQDAGEICKEAARAYGELLQASDEWHIFMTEKTKKAAAARAAYNNKKEKRQIAKPDLDKEAAIICVPGTNKGPNGEPCIRLCKQDPFSDNLVMVDDWGDADGECPKMTLPQPVGQKSANPEDKFNKSKKTKKMIRLRKAVNKLNPTPEEK
jgi:hypothetical protein